MAIDEPEVVLRELTQTFAGDDLDCVRAQLGLRQGASAADVAIRAAPDGDGQVVIQHVKRPDRTDELGAATLAALPAIVERLDRADVQVALPGRLARVPAVGTSEGAVKAEQAAVGDGGTTVASAGGTPPRVHDAQRPAAMPAGPTASIPAPPSGPTPRPAPDGRRAVGRLPDAFPAVEPDIGDDTEDEASLDHSDPDDLRAAYDRHETIADAAEEFEVSYQTVYKRLKHHGIHEPGDRPGDEPAGGAAEEDGSDGGAAVGADIEPPAWLDEDPRTIVDERPGVGCDLEQLLVDVDRNDDILSISQRLGGTTVSQTRGVLDDLGLSDDSGSRLADQEVLDERLPALWDYLRAVGEVADGV
jgi:hypothetical protein